ncbi:MAG: TonB-dependent receptor, partial [Caulobacteraceae bacterium]
YRQASFATGATLNLGRTDLAASPRLALVFKPTAWQSFYLAYGTSFDPSAEALTLTSKTAALGPVKARSYEAGSKSSLLDGRLLLTGAVFLIQVDNAQSNDPDNPTITVLEGTERVQGLELDASGHLTPTLKIEAGYTYLDGRSTGVGSAGPFTATAAPNLAHNQANLWAEWKATPALELGLGVNYLGRRFADVYNAAALPAYATLDAMASYKLTPAVTLQLNATNLTDALYYESAYYASAAENHAVPGPGRTIKLALRARFK